MSEGGGQGRTKMKASEFRFTRVRSWLGGDATERIEGWKTYVYEAAGKMKAVNITKVRRVPLLCRRLLGPNHNPKITTLKSTELPLNFKPTRA